MNEVSISAPLSCNIVASSLSNRKRPYSRPCKSNMGLIKLHFPLNAKLKFLSQSSMNIFAIKFSFQSGTWFDSLWYALLKHVRFIDYASLLYEEDTINFCVNKILQFFQCIVSKIRWENTSQFTTILSKKTRAQNGRYVKLINVSKSCHRYLSF